MGRILRTKTLHIEPLNQSDSPSPCLPPPNLSHRCAGNGWGEGRGEGRRFLGRTLPSIFISAEVSIHPSPHPSPQPLKAKRWRGVGEREIGRGEPSRVCLLMHSSITWRIKPLNQEGTRLRLRLRLRAGARIQPFRFLGREGERGTPFFNMRSGAFQVVAVMSRVRSCKER